MSRTIAAAVLGLLAVPLPAVAIDGVAIDGVAIDGVAIDGVAIDGVAIDGVADGDTTAPAWSADAEEEVTRAVTRDFSTEAVGVTAEWVPLERTGLSGPDGARCRSLRFHQGDATAHFTEILLCPWASMWAAIQTPGEMILTAPRWTVTPTALVFGPWSGPDGALTDPALLERIETTVAAALDVEHLQAPCDQDPATAIPADVQLISAECHRYYISLQIAQPGSRVPDDDELLALAPGMMVELWLIPDRGEVLHRWIAPPGDTGVLAPLSSLGPEFAGPGQFGDYTPKETPDTVLDYRGALAPRLGELPPESLEALPELVLLLQRQQRQARELPGEWIDGNVILGADPREYLPSDDELLEAAIGERIARVVEASGPKEVRRTLRKAKVKVREVFYRGYTFRHVDVMGSGRFFYASGPEEQTIAIP